MWPRPLKFGTHIGAASQGLYWSMGAVAVALMAHIRTLPIWIPVLIALAAVWRIHIERRALRLPPRWLRLLISIAAIVAVLGAFRTLNGLEAGTALLAV